ncbi:MAG: tetraacyldisaccharide 4'-kinase [Pseudomonadota bacterium]
MRDWLYRVWYEGGRGGWLLWPLAGLFGVLSALHRALFRWGIKPSQAVDARVIVVGNIAVGGAGKTPVTGWLAQALADAGARVAIVSRGYGGNAVSPLQVRADTDPAVAGDEAVMQVRQSGLPVFVGRDRVAACQLAIAEGAEVIVCDDGLQHYRLRRDIEIAVVDGERRHGNGWLLPAGPLRETPARLATVDHVLVHGGSAGDFHLDVDHAVNLANGERRSLTTFKGQTLHAVAGIGHPERFFLALEQHDITVQRVPLPDHAAAPAVLGSLDSRYDVLMTDKDAVKYVGADARFWRVPAMVVMERTKAQAVLTSCWPAAGSGGEHD